MRAALSAMPTRDGFFGRIGASTSVSKEARDAHCYAELGVLVDVQVRAIGGLSELLANLDLDDHRKA